jgi:hypothetical protein
LRSRAHWRDRKTNNAGADHQTFYRIHGTKTLRRTAVRRMSDPDLLLSAPA